MRIDQLNAAPNFFLSEGGLETYMVFVEGFDLPCFSAGALLESEAGRAALGAYYERHIAIARDAGRGFVMDTPTWRSGVAWADALGKTDDEILAANGEAVRFVSSFRDRHETDDLPILVNGVIGPAGDGYAPEEMITPARSMEIHLPQIRALRDAGVDMITAMTITHMGEAAGIAKAARALGVPVVISFTLETDGRLPSGQSLGDAILEVDGLTRSAPVYYMINCAHPDHFSDVLARDSLWIERIGGVRANASRMSHAELDEAETLDDGDPVELAQLNAQLAARLPNLRVIGGCCGTDHRHIACIAGHDHALAA